MRDTPVLPRWIQEALQRPAPSRGYRVEPESGLLVPAGMQRQEYQQAQAGDIKNGYASSVSLTVTNLHSLASSQTWIAGWSSLSYSNLTNKYLDYCYSGTFTTHASNRQAGFIFVYVLAALNDTPTWTATASGTIGTEGTLSFTDTEEMDALARLLTVITVDNTASAIYAFPPTGIAQLFGGSVPPYHALYVAQNCSTTTTAGLASSGSAIYQNPTYRTYT